MSLWPNRRFLCRLSVLVLALTALVWLPGAAAEGIRHEEIIIPARFSGPQGSRELRLSALVVRPDDSARHPLALINHGSPRSAAEKRNRTAYRLYSQSLEFARRGWVAVAVLRRGYGPSEDDGTLPRGASCERRTYTEYGLHQAEDIRAVIPYLGTLPYVDAGRILSVGVSVGGLATVALTADPPPGLVAGISFAGGSGSPTPDTVCNPEALIEAFRSYGRRSRVPMLWVYAENDHFFGPALAGALHRAFTEAGGNAQLILAPPFGDDGHYLFSQTGAPHWTPYVDEFLAVRGLTQRRTPIALTLPPVPPPAQLSAKGRESFQNYLAAGPHKAFAVSPKGAYGWRAGLATLEQAQAEALEACQKNTPLECTLAMREDTPAP
jgi:dienelactone hydrolase